MPPELQNDTSNQPLDNAINASTGATDNGVLSGTPTPPLNEPTPTPQNPPETPAGDPAPSASAEGDSGKKTPWFQRRIDQLTAEKWEERRTVENLRKQTSDLLAELAEARKSGQAAPMNTQVGTPVTPPVNTPPATPLTMPTDRSMSEAEINALVEQRAEERARVKAFNDTCNRVAEAGKDEFDDFEKKIGTFKMLGGMPTPLLETITEMPNAHKILYSLGSDPDLAERVIKMPPVKQALELARLENSLGKPASRQVSSAPPPVQPIDTGSRATDDPDKMSMEDFVNWREKQLAAKKK